MNKGMMTPGPGNDEYETPGWFYKSLDAEFGFNFDAAARDMPTQVRVKDGAALALTKPNYLCNDYSLEISGSVAAGRLVGKRVFCNPPYSKIDTFVFASINANASLWVYLLPVRTDNDWFGYLQKHAELRFLRKRIQFELNSVPADSPRFTSLVAVLRK